MKENPTGENGKNGFQAHQQRSQVGFNPFCPINLQGIADTRRENSGIENRYPACRRLETFTVSKRAIQTADRIEQVKN